MHAHAETRPTGPKSRSAAERTHPSKDRRRTTPVQLVANRTGLPDSLKAGVESLSGRSFDHVRVRRNSSKPAQLNAHAYAQGGDIHLAPGQEKHLPHEAWHVVQQAQDRVKPTLQMKSGVPVNDDPSLEREADVMGARASHITAATGPAASPPPVSAPGSSPVQRIRGQFGGNPKGRGGKGKKFIAAPPGKGRKGQGFDRGSSEAARRSQGGKHEEFQQRQSTVRARLQQRLQQRHENLLRAIDAAQQERDQPPPTRLEPAPELEAVDQNDQSADDSEAEVPVAAASSSQDVERDQQLEAETTLRITRNKFALLARAIAANSKAINEYRFEGAPYAMQFSEQAQALATQADGLLTRAEFPPARDRNAFYRPAKAFIDELEAMIGQGKVKELVEKQKITEAATAAEERKAELLSRSKEGLSKAQAAAQAKIKAEADAYLAEMRAKYQQYRNDKTNTVNRGAYYQRPNGAPPASKVVISKPAMALVMAAAPASGFVLFGSLTSSVSFHKDVPGGRPSFIFHI